MSRPNYLPDLRFLPENLNSISATTALNDGISVGTFLKNITLDHITDQEQRKQIARNLLPHAQILKSISNNKKFASHKLVVVEGLYKADPEEKITENDTNPNYLATTGRSIVYELRRNKKMDIDKTFELIRYIKIYLDFFDKIILDYDTNQEDTLNAQIIIQTPEIPINYDVNFKGTSETQFNNTLLASGQLIEVTESPISKVEFPADVPDEVEGYFTLGDFHARLLRAYGGAPWQSYAQDSRLARNNEIFKNLRKIKKESNVVISTGYNDAVTTTDEPFDIARSVAKIVGTAANKRHVVTYLLPPLTTQGNVDRQKAVRATILSELSQQSTRFGHNVRIIDLNASEYTLGLDGKSLTPESYIAIANTLI